MHRAGCAAGTLTAMPEAPDENRAAGGNAAAERSLTGFGFGSAVAGVIAVVAVALAAMVWSHHHDESQERAYQTRVLQTAADWSSTLININADTVEAGMQKLREGTVGQLNAGFDAALAPYRDLVQRLAARTSGRLDSVAIETLYHPPVGPDGRPLPTSEDDLAGMVGRTDTVLVVATSVSENAGSEQPRTVRWNFRLDVSDVDGALMVSRLELIR